MGEVLALCKDCRAEQISVGLAKLRLDQFRSVLVQCPIIQIATGFQAEAQQIMRRRQIGIVQPRHSLFLVGHQRETVGAAWRARSRPSRKMHISKHSAGDHVILHGASIQRPMAGECR